MGKITNNVDIPVIMKINYIIQNNKNFEPSRKITAEKLKYARSRGNI